MAFSHLCPICKLYSESPIGLKLTLHIQSAWRLLRTGDGISLSPMSRAASGVSNKALMWYRHCLRLSGEKSSIEVTTLVFLGRSPGLSPSTKICIADRCRRRPPLRTNGIQISIQTRCQLVNRVQSTGEEHESRSLPGNDALPLWVDWRN